MSACKRLRVLNKPYEVKRAEVLPGGAGAMMLRIAVILDNLEVAADCVQLAVGDLDLDVRERSHQLDQGSSVAPLRAVKKLVATERYAVVEGIARKRPALRARHLRPHQAMRGLDVQE